MKTLQIFYRISNLWTISYTEDEVNIFQIEFLLFENRNIFASCKNSLLHLYLLLFSYIPLKVKKKCYFLITHKFEISILLSHSTDGYDLYIYTSYISAIFFAIKLEIVLSKNKREYRRCKVALNFLLIKKNQNKINKNSRQINLIFIINICSNIKSWYKR